MISILHTTIIPVCIGSFEYLIIQNIHSLTVRCFKQIETVVSSTIFNPNLKISLSPVGRQLKILEYLNSFSLVVYVTKMKFFLRDFASLKEVVVSNSAWKELFNQEQQEVISKDIDSSLGYKQIT